MEAPIGHLELRVRTFRYILSQRGLSAACMAVLCPTIHMTFYDGSHAEDTHNTADLGYHARRSNKVIT